MKLIKIIEKLRELLDDAICTLIDMIDRYFFIIVYMWLAVLLSIYFVGLYYIYRLMMSKKRGKTIQSKKHLKKQL